MTKTFKPYLKINYLNRGAQGIDIVALGIDFVAVKGARVAETLHFYYLMKLTSESYLMII